MAVDSVQIIDTATPTTKQIKISGSGDIAIRLFLDGVEQGTIWHNLTTSPYTYTWSNISTGTHQVCAQQM